MVAYEESFDYIVIGSGAGGGVVAARLAEAGKSVLLLEAGGDPLAEDRARAPTGRNLADDYRVPAFNAFASEHPDMRWDFWVRHYDDPAFQKRDWRYRESYENEKVNGVLYPRCSALGGCTAHNAMIIVRPHNADWNHIWKTMGDASWKASRMQRYFRRLERCRYRNFLYRWLARLGWNPTGHGWDGWLTTEKAIPLRAILDRGIRETISHSIGAAIGLLPDAAERWRWLVKSQGDPNDERLVDERAFGVRMIPLSTSRHGRCGTRELLLDVRQRRPENLTIRLNAIVTRIEIDPESKVATGVAYREGKKLYRAAAGPRNSEWSEKRVGATREVILAGGVFNTPQLLMLSGIGCPDQLSKLDIDVVQPLPGVGQNLQDRYEVSVVSQMKAPWKAMRGARYNDTDKHYRRWRLFRKGIYTSNGGMMSVMMRSKTDRERPDLFCFALLADFRGYYPGYAERLKKIDYLSWVVLKAHSRNTAGEVRLKSNDPLEQPAIRFRYFHEGNDTRGDDLESVAAGVRFVRKVADSMADLIDEEETPGRHIYTDQQIKDHIGANAWGHHACGTCAMKPQDQGGVVDSDFKVYGIDRLRIVDASIFPRIPGFFIVTSVYMIAEKAADAILERSA